MILSLIAFETLFVVYWVGLKLIPTLPYFGFMAALVFVSGKKSLGEMRRSRVERERKEMGKTE